MLHDYLKYAGFASKKMTFIHVLEQVQCFKQSDLNASPSVSEIVTGDKVMPSIRTVWKQLINSEVPRMKRNSKNSRLEDLEKAVVLVVVWLRETGFCVLFPSAVTFLLDAWSV